MELLLHGDIMKEPNPFQKRFAKQFGYDIDAIMQSVKESLKLLNVAHDCLADVVGEEFHNKIHAIAGQQTIRDDTDDDFQYEGKVNGNCIYSMSQFLLIDKHDGDDTLLKQIKETREVYE